MQGRVGRRLLLAACLPRPARSAPGSEQVLRLGFAEPLDSPSGVAAQRFSAILASLSAGRIRVELYPDGSQGDADDLVAGLQDGSMPLAVVPDMAAAAAVPALGICAIPFLFSDVQAARRVLDSPAGDACLEPARMDGLAAIGWWELGMRHLASRRAALRAPAELRGLRLSVPPADAEILGFRLLGADVSVSPESAAPLAEACSVSLPGLLTDDLWHSYAHVALTAHGYAPAVVLASGLLWDGLAEADRSLLTQAARMAAPAARAWCDAAAAAALDRLGSLGVTVAAVADRASFVQALAPAAAPFARLFGGPRIAALRDAV